MIKKIALVLVNIILILVPFSPLTEIISGTEVGYKDFSSYLMVCGFIAAFCLLPAVFINYKNTPATQQNLLVPAWLLFILGILVMVPLHMGPPKEAETLLNATGEEKFRYIMLIIAVFVFSAGIITSLKPFQPKLSLAEKMIFIPLAITFFISLWDHYDSFSFSSKLTTWVSGGKNAADFFPNYDFHDQWRAAGRMLLYVVAAWTSIILYKQSVISMWVTVVLVLFCVVSVGFCTMFLLRGPAFYFPFMVPAVALAPSYWLGIALLNKTSLK
jgi:hypothetical protein